MKDYDKIILRRKGGPRKGEVNTSPTHALNRLHRREFGASATLGKFVRFMLGNHQSVSNYGISGKIYSMPPDESYTLLLSIGVRFGSLDDHEKIQLLDNLGAAKILGTM
jgi:hypothetical protein